MEQVKSPPILRTPESEYPECKFIWERMRERGRTDAEILAFLDAM